MRHRWRVEHCSVLVCLVAGTTLLWLLVLSIGSRATAANVLPGSKHKHYWWFNGDEDDGTDIPFRLTGRACLGLVGSFLAAALSNAAGIGGGAFFVPLYNIVVGFGLKTSTGLSQAAIVGGSLTGLVFNLCMRHPWDPSRPLVDLDVALVLTPALLLGVSAGVLLNDLLPDWFITLLLVSLLLVMSRRTFLRGCTSWAEETQQKANLKAAEAISSGPMPTLRPICTEHVPSVAVLPSLTAALPPDSSDEDQTASDKNAATGGGSSAAGQATGAPQQEQQQQQQQQPGMVPLYSGHADVAGCDQHGDVSDTAAATSTNTAAAAGAESGAVVFRTECEQSPGSSLLSKQRQLQAWCQQQQLLLAGQRTVSAALVLASSDGGQQQQLQQAAPLMQSSIPPAAAAAAAAAGPGVCSPGDGGVDSVPGSAMSSGAAPVFCTIWAAQQARYRFPWVKLCCLVLLWLGFLGLSALDAMLPLCSWQYVSYMLVFILLTVCVTCVFIRAVIVGPSVPSGEPSTTGSTRSKFSRAREASRRSSWWSRLCWWPAAPTAAAGAAAADLEEGERQLAQPFIIRHTSSFADIASAASVAGSSTGSLTQGQVAAAASAVAGAAGVLAGVVGLGGGTMIGPILLEFKIHPQVASATSVVLVFISSSAATLSFLMEGRLVLGYALVFALAAAAGSLSGVTLVAALVRRTGRPSSIILLLAGCMAAGALLSAVFGGMDVMASIQDNDGLHPRSICPA